MRFLRNLRTSRSPSWPFLFESVEFWKICSSCYFCHICNSIFSHSKKNSSYFCDFCDIWYFFYTFRIAVFFKSFLLKLGRQFASKFLLTRSILDISELWRPCWRWCANGCINSQHCWELERIITFHESKNFLLTEAVCCGVYVIYVCSSVGWLAPRAWQNLPDEVAGEGLFLVTGIGRCYCWEGSAMSCVCCLGQVPSKGTIIPLEMAC